MGVSSLDGVAGLVGWLVGGALVGGAAGYLATGTALAPLSQLAGAGLGTALGGGFGVVANLLVTGSEPEPDTDEVTVEMDDESGDSQPRPADLFEGHPDPVAYVVDDGHGPVVRAVNPAFEDAFDVPCASVAGAPLAEALFVAAEETDPERVAAAATGGDLDRTVALETPDGAVPFRVRTAGDPEDGYVLFTRPGAG